MKKSSLIVILVIAFYNFAATAAPWQPENGNVQVPLWPDAAPGRQIVTGPEGSGLDTVGTVAGKPWMYVHDVIKPTMTVYSPKGKNSGAAVVVFLEAATRFLR